MLANSCYNNYGYFHFITVADPENFLTSFLANHTHYDRSPVYVVGRGFSLRTLGQLALFSVASSPGSLWAGGGEPGTH